MIYTKNHPSEWTKFFDEHPGRYRYKPRDRVWFKTLLMAIGKVFTSEQKALRKKAAKVATEIAGQNLGEKAAEKGSDVI